MINYHFPAPDKYLCRPRRKFHQQAFRCNAAIVVGQASSLLSSCPDRCGAGPDSVLLMLPLIGSRKVSWQISFWQPPDSQAAQTDAAPARSQFSACDKCIRALGDPLPIRHDSLCALKREPKRSVGDHFRSACLSLFFRYQHHHSWVPCRKLSIICLVISLLFCCDAAYCRSPHRTSPDR